MTKDWRHLTSEILFEYIGPVTEVIIDDALESLEAEQRNIIHARDYVTFVKALYKELPDDIDRKAVCEQLWAEMMNHKVF